MGLDAMAEVANMVGMASTGPTMEDHMNNIEAFVKVVKGASKADREKMLEDALVAQTCKKKSSKK